MFLQCFQQGIRNNQENGQTITSLIFSKSRIAPLKEISLPRLELQLSLLLPEVSTSLRRVSSLKSIKRPCGQIHNASYTG